MGAANRLCLTCGTEYSGFISVCPEDQTRLTVLSQDERVGTVLADRYDILEIIGTGGMGTVYKARQRLINRIVAIKMLHKTMMSSADVLRRFQLEAQAASRLSLPNILTIYDFGLTEEGQPYMVMDYLNGTSLDKIILSQHHLEPVRALNIFIQACTALAHAHTHEVLHRDIKPSNIMLVNFDDQSDFVKIVDFGIAKMMNKIEGQAAELTKTGEVYGSPPYMSPEQCRGLELDNRADIYSLACVLYKSLVGKNPMQSTGDSMPLQIMLKHINEKAPSFAEAAPDLFLSNKLEAVVFKALEKNPDDRYQTMLEFKEALEKVRDVLIAESKASQMMREPLGETFEQDDVMELNRTMNNTQNSAQQSASPRPRKQLIDDPTPLLPNATVPFDQQLSPSAGNADLWPEMSQAALSSQPQQTSATPAQASSAPTHNLSPSEFLSTLNSQLTQSALAPSPQTAPQAVAPQSAPQQAPAPVVEVSNQQAQGGSAPGYSPLMNLANQSGNVQSPSQAAPAPSAPPNADVVAKPAPPVARATFAEALQATLPSPDTQMLSIVQAPQSGGASAPKSPQSTASAAPLQDRRSKSMSQPSLPAQPAPVNYAPVSSAAPPVSPPVSVFPQTNMPQNLGVNAVPPTPSVPPAQAVPTAQAPIPPLKPTLHGPPPTNFSSAPMTKSATNMPSAADASAKPAPAAGKAKVDQTLKEIPALGAKMPTLREQPALSAELPGTPVDSKIPVSVLDGIKAPNVKPATRNTQENSLANAPAQKRGSRTRFDEAAESPDRSNRLSENRRKFIKHETDSSKTMLVIAGLAFVVILSAFFTFSYFNSLPKQAQTAPAGQNQTTVVESRPVVPTQTTASESRPTALSQIQPAKPMTGSGSAGSAVTAATPANMASSASTSQSAQPAPVRHKSHKAPRSTAAASTSSPASSGSTAPASGVRRHAYSSYGTSY